MPLPLDSLQGVADEAIRTWPDVRAKNVFGHRGYVRGGKMFAFMAEKGVAIKAENGAQAETLYAAGQATPFIYNGDMEMRAWPVLPLSSAEQIADILSAVRAAYEGLG